MKELLLKTINLLKIILLYFSVIISCCYCKNNLTKEGYSKISPSISYKLITIGETLLPINENDVVQLKAVFKTENDSVFWDWQYNANKSFFIEFNKKTRNTNLLGFIFKTFNVGDSLHIIAGKTTVFREIFDTVPAWFVTNDSTVKIELFIEKTMSKQEFTSYKLKEQLKMESEKYGEAKIIADYVLTNFNFPEKADCLLYFEKQNITKDSLAKKGKTITISYRGTFMDLKAFDEAKLTNPTVINFGYCGQMLPGIEKVIPYLRRGENAKIIIPSHLGFGDNGSTNGSVPPNSTLLYEIKIIDVK